MKHILVIDYGVGNHQSVENALKFLGAKYIISGHKRDIVQARAFIFPGVGAFAEATHNLSRRGIGPALRDQVLVHKKPLLGICLGMQLLAQDSQENGLHPGLGWLKGHVVKLNPTRECKIPHVGWNNLTVKLASPLFSQLPPRPTFYFDHSYHFAADPQLVSATAWHGTEVIAAIQHQHIFGVQFHPEKSQRHGLKFLRAFLNFVDHYA